MAKTVVLESELMNIPFVNCKWLLFV